MDGQPKPVDVDGVFAVGVGTALWFVAFVVLLPLHHRLADDGRLWWLATTVVGWCLGLLGLAYCLRRRRRLPPPAERAPET